MDEQYKKENLKKILENKKINPKELIAVRVCSSNELNKKDNEIYASPLRPTIHFSLNHFVKEEIGGGRLINGSFLRDTWEDVYSAKLKKTDNFESKNLEKYQKYIQKWKKHWENINL